MCPTNNVVERDEHVLTGRRPVHEHGRGWQVTPARLHARQISRNKRAGNANVRRIPQQAVGVAQLKGKAKNRARRTKELAPIRKPWKPVILLRLRAELMQQLTGTEGIGHHHGDRRSNRARRDKAYHLGVGEG